ncbi:MAG TPA: manganese transporter [Microbacterium sp.]|nr:manganese transporter [Microbacterium sp.]
MRRCFRHLVLVLAGIAVLCGSGCAESNDGQATRTGEEGEPRLRIVCTVGMVTDVVRAVAGDRADVTGLLGSGVDPHLYKPTRSDIARMLEADAIFYNGLLLEGRMTDSLVRAARGGKAVHAVTEGIDESFLLLPEGFEGHPDPHVWMDPGAWIETIGVVREALVALDPEGEPAYRANADAYREQLEALDRYASRVLGTVPEAQRVLVTAHDAFNYFGRRFGYEVVGIQGISTESEAGVLDIEGLVDLLVEREIGAVFVESTVSTRNIEALVSGTRSRGHTVVIGGELFSDAMGDPGTYEGTYLGMIDHNVTTIARALGGAAPARGMSDRLSASSEPGVSPEPGAGMTEEDG